MPVNLGDTTIVVAVQFHDISAKNWLKYGARPCVAERQRSRCVFEVKNLEVYRTNIASGFKVCFSSVAFIFFTLNQDKQLTFFLNHSV